MVESSRRGAVGFGAELRVLSGSLPFGEPRDPKRLASDMVHFVWFHDDAAPTHARVAVTLVNARGERSNTVVTDVHDPGMWLSPLPEALRLEVVEWLDEHPFGEDFDPLGGHDACLSKKRPRAARCAPWRP